MVWGAIGQIASSLIGGASSLGGGILSYDAQRKLMDKAYKQQIAGLKESPTAQREGLENAGYNPIIPFFSGGSMGNYATGSTGTAPQYNLEGLNKYLERKNLQNQTALTEADTKLKNEQAETEKQQQTELGTRAELNNLMGYKNLAEAIYTEGRNTREDKKFAYEVNNLISETIKNKLQTELFKSEKKYTDERSRGYSYSWKGPLGIGIETTGNNKNIYANQKGEWKEFPNKYGNGTHKEFVYYNK